MLASEGGSSILTTNLQQEGRPQNEQTDQLDLQSSHKPQGLSSIRPHSLSVFFWGASSSVFQALTTLILFLESYCMAKAPIKDEQRDGRARIGEEEQKLHLEQRTQVRGVVSTAG